MSGGHFDYNQYRIRDIADSIDQIIRNNGEKKNYKVSSWEDEYYYEYPPEVIEKFKEGLDVLRKAGATDETSKILNIYNSEAQPSLVVG